MCKECQKRDINVRTGELVKRCSERVEVEINYADDTCKEIYNKIHGKLSKLQKNPEILIRIVDKAKCITITAQIKDIHTLVYLHLQRKDNGQNLQKL